MDSGLYGHGNYPPGMPDDATPDPRPSLEDSGSSALVDVTPGPGYPGTANPGGNLSGVPGKGNPAASVTAAGTPGGFREARVQKLDTPPGNADRVP